MIIDVDIGNTLVKWRIRGHSELHAAPDWQALLALVEQEDVDRLCIACVRNASERSRLLASLSACCSAHIEFATVQAGVLGVEPAYLSLGVDRWLSILWCRSQDVGRPWVVAAGGTALTIDWIEGDGRHLGGFVMPGIGLAKAALDTAAAGLDVNAISLGGDWQPGGTTLECLQSGYSALYGACLRDIHAKASAAMGEVCVGLAGGDAQVLRNLLAIDGAVHVNTSMVLDGVALALP